MINKTSGEKRFWPPSSVMTPLPPVTARAKDMMKTVGTDSTIASNSATCTVNKGSDDYSCGVIVMAIRMTMMKTIAMTKSHLSLKCFPLIGSALLIGPCET